MGREKKNVLGGRRVRVTFIFVGPQRQQEPEGWPPPAFVDGESVAERKKQMAKYYFDGSGDERKGPVKIMKMVLRWISCFKT